MNSDWIFSLNTYLAVKIISWLFFLFGSWRDIRLWDCSKPVRHTQYPSACGVATVQMGKSSNASLSKEKTLRSLTDC